VLSSNSEYYIFHINSILNGKKFEWGELVRTMPMHFWFSVPGLSAQFRAKTTRPSIFFHGVANAFQHFKRLLFLRSFIKIFGNQYAVAMAQCLQLKMAANLCILSTGWVQQSCILRYNQRISIEFEYSSDNMLIRVLGTIPSYLSSFSACYFILKEVSSHGLKK